MIERDTVWKKKETAVGLDLTNYLRIGRLAVENFAFQGTTTNLYCYEVSQNGIDWDNREKRCVEVLVVKSYDFTGKKEALINVEVKTEKELNRLMRIEED